MTDSVVYQVSDRVAHVRLNRPKRLNSLDRQMFEALVDVGRELIDRQDVSVVVLSGAGRAFCAGLDLAQFDAMRTGGAEVVVGGERLGAAGALAQKSVHVWSLLPQPVIAGVHGYALGGGLQVALGADIRVVSPTTKLSVMEIQWGLIPDMAGTQLLPELVGRDVAKELTFTGRTVLGVEAQAIGLATRVADDPIEGAVQLAEEIASHSRSALGRAKRLLDMAGRVPLAEGLDAEQDALAALMGSDEQTAVVENRLRQRSGA
jgi:enoyl-CoA hydratase/carnithine racemase